MWNGVHETPYTPDGRGEDGCRKPTYIHVSPVPGGQPLRSTGTEVAVSVRVLSWSGWSIPLLRVWVRFNGMKRIRDFTYALPVMIPNHRKRACRPTDLRTYTKVSAMSRCRGDAGALIPRLRGGMGWGWIGLDWDRGPLPYNRFAFTVGDDGGYRPVKWIGTRGRMLDG